MTLIAMTSCKKMQPVSKSFKFRRLHCMIWLGLGDSVFSSIYEASSASKSRPSSAAKGAGPREQAAPLVPSRMRAPGRVLWRSRANRASSHLCRCVLTRVATTVSTPTRPSSLPSRRTRTSQTPSASVAASTTTTSSSPTSSMTTSWLSSPSAAAAAAPSTVWVGLIGSASSFPISEAQVLSREV